MVCGARRKQLSTRTKKSGEVTFCDVSGLRIQPTATPSKKGRVPLASDKAVDLTTTYEEANDA